MARRTETGLVRHAGGKARARPGRRELGHAGALRALRTRVGSGHSVRPLQQAEEEGLEAGLCEPHCQPHKAGHRGGFAAVQAVAAGGRGDGGR